MFKYYSRITDKLIVKSILAINSEISVGSITISRPYFLNSDNYFIKSQTLDTSSNLGFTMYVSMKSLL